MNGWVRLHRQVIESEIFADSDLLKLFIWLLCRTSFKRSPARLTVGRGCSTVMLEPGQCIVGRHAAAEELGWPPSTFRDRLAKLEAMGIADRHPDTHWTIVSIVNWDKYQSVDDRETTGIPTPNRQASDNQPTHSENAKKTKKESSARKFKVPKVEEVRAYCQERKNTIDADQFVDHYTANGWTQGRGKPIRNWKAAVRTWERNGIRSEVRSEVAEPSNEPGPTLDDLAKQSVVKRRGRYDRS